jgi:glyoxylase-like metal-dependent hydrolase (beta-lactamase superfamily II)
VLVEWFPAGPLATNCYVVAPAVGEECLVIDPGVNAGARLDEVVRRHRLRPVAVLLTHGHFDHTFSVLPVCGARGVPAYIHPDDRGQLTDPWAAIGGRRDTPLFGRLTWSEPDDLRMLADGDVLALAGLDLGVRLAPGHTPGSVAFASAERVAVGTQHGPAAGPALFTGDLLFAGSVGRTDFPGGSAPELLRSLAAVVLPRPDDTVVLPGHGAATTVGRERRDNPFLARAAAAGVPAVPTSLATVERGRPGSAWGRAPAQM